MQLFPPLPPRSVLGGNIARALVALVLIVAVDQFTKWLVVEQMNLRVVKAIDFIPFLNFRMAWNPGVNFGLLSADTEMGRWLLIGFTGAISAALLAAALCWCSATRCPTTALGVDCPPTTRGSGPISLPPIWTGISN